MENQEEVVRCIHGCPYHPATGHVLDKTGRAVLCGRHTREFFGWVKEHTNGWAREEHLDTIYRLMVLDF